MQHYDFKNQHGCRVKMKTREIFNENDNICKELNTFIIHSSKNQMKAFCSNSRTFYAKPNLYRSNQPFFVITCELKRGIHRNRCKYKEQPKSTQYLIIGCENKLPVHYEGDRRNIWSPTFLVLLVATVIVATVKEETKYKKFLRQHFKNQHGCTTEIKRRKIFNEKYNTCKRKNSFIVSSTTNQIKDICDKAGTFYGEPNLYRSNQPFPVITCRLKKGTYRNNCEYNDGKKSSRYLIIGCENKLP
ncbi:angiogenin-4-like, partial [Scleropages formosus]